MIFAFDTSRVVALRSADGELAGTLLSSSSPSLLTGCLSRDGAFLYLLDSALRLHRLPVAEERWGASSSFELDARLRARPTAIVATNSFLVIANQEELVAINPRIFADAPSLRQHSLRIAEHLAWVHLGDGDFSVDSADAAKMVLPLSGATLELGFALSPDARESRGALAIGYVCGDIRGLDNPLKMALNGHALTPLATGGRFRVDFDPAWLVPDANLLEIIPNVGSDGTDDIELGNLELWLEGALQD